MQQLVSHLPISLDIRALHPKNLGWTLLTSAVFCGLALGCIELTRYDGPIATIWIPNAVVTAIMLHSAHDKANPLVFLGIFAGSVVANLLADFPLHHSWLFAFANVVEIAIAVGLTRHWCGGRPRLEDTHHLSRFILASGIVACAIAGLISFTAISIGGSIAFENWLGWFLTDALGMIIIVPIILLGLDALRSEVALTSEELAELAILLIMAGGFTALLFYQTELPLLFLITPIVLVLAFKTGGLGSALFAGLASCITTAMTWMGYGPISAATAPTETKLLILQAFMAANFLIGVPVAAILSGRQRILAELAEQQRQMALLADNITDAILRYDLNGICTYISPSAREVLDADPAEFIGQKASDRMHPESREIIERTEKRLLSGQSAKERITYRRYHDGEHGRPVYIEADCSVMRDPETGAPEAIIVSSRDVTERFELEILLRKARAEAEEATRAKSEFLANMSHEIRTPMNGVLGFAELMLHNDLSPDQRKQVELIVQSGRSMMMLLNDILDLSKIEAGQIEIDRQAFWLEHLVRGCAQLHLAAAERKGLKISVEGFEDVGQIISDNQRLRQILLNLIGNALKFTSRGEITLRCDIDDDLLRLSVRDTGIGIDRDQLSQIFRPFSQAENDTAKRFGGTGLGLSISRQLAELLDGYIDVESELGIGTCFTLTIPLVEPDEPTEEPAPPIEEPVDLEGPNSLPPACHILLVEDHDINRLLVRTMLERCGQRVSTAINGEQAIAKVLEAELHGEPYELVLMDIQMPGCDGYQATRAIRAEGIKPEALPIIALSANAFPEDIAASKQAGMQAHIAKPLVFADLVLALQRWLPVKLVGWDEEAEPQVGTAEPNDGGPETHAREKLERDFNEALSAPHHIPSPALQIQWQHRRRDAIEAISVALRESKLTGASGDELAALVHKLAGTAGMFGEEELGERAAAFERALRSGVGNEVREQLARELLEAA
jgi:PAS domain S-box-containing protein